MPTLTRLFITLQDLFDLINAHFGVRQSLASAEAELEQREIQLRSIQKRLLVRYQDKNAAPLNQLDQVFEETYETSVNLTDKVIGVTGCRALQVVY